MTLPDRSLDRYVETAAPILLYLGRDKLGGVAGRHGAMVGVASE